MTKVARSRGHVCNEWSEKTGTRFAKAAVVQIEFDGPLGPLVRRICWSHAEGSGLIDSEGHLLVGPTSTDLCHKLY